VKDSPRRVAEDLISLQVIVNGRVRKGGVVTEYFVLFVAEVDANDLEKRLHPFGQSIHFSEVYQLHFLQEWTPLHQQSEKLKQIHFSKLSTT